MFPQNSLFVARSVPVVAGARESNILPPRGTKPRVVHLTVTDTDGRSPSRTNALEKTNTRTGEAFAFQTANRESRPEIPFGPCAAGLLPQGGTKVPQRRVHPALPQPAGPPREGRPATGARNALDRPVLGSADHSVSLNLSGQLRTGIQ
jgi:hypothetical protein